MHTTLSVQKRPVVVFLLFVFPNPNRSELKGLERQTSDGSSLQLRSWTDIVAVVFPAPPSTALEATLLSEQMKTLPGLCELCIPCQSWLTRPHRGRTPLTADTSARPRIL
jgi:hypothetical protein